MKRLRRLHADSELRRKLDARGRKLDRLRDRLAAKERELADVRRGATADSNAGPAGIQPESMIWIFGAHRTGSTWLSNMLGDLEAHVEWKEPLVGLILGYDYLIPEWWRDGADLVMRDRADFLLSDKYQEVWLNSIRALVLDGANARYPDVADHGYLVIKEPNGSIGAPVIARALPQSRLVFLVRDPRDIVASLLAAHSEGSWIARVGLGDPLADRDPEEFVRKHAHHCMDHLLRAQEAYEHHAAPKALVRYEDLRADAAEELKRICRAIEVPVDEGQLRRAVERHDWESVPAELKGVGEHYRKALPGCYEDDLTREQIRAVEEIAAPILDKLYPEGS